MEPVDPNAIVSPLWIELILWPERFYRKFVRSGIELHADLMGKHAYREFPRYFQGSKSARSFESLKIGETASATADLTHAKLLYFARSSDDWNPIHFNEAFAAKTRFKRPIAHGLLVGSFVSALLSNELPGRGTVYESQNFSFKAPVYIGDKITTTVKITKLEAERQRVTLWTEARNQDGVIVSEGEAVVRMMNQEKNRL